MTIEKDKCPVFGVNYTIASISGAVLFVKDHIEELRGKYICFSNVHTTVMARESKDYKDVLNGAAFVFADGNPIAKRQRKKGYRKAERVAGPDFMEQMFKATADGKISHYFYGAKDGTLKALEERLKEKYPKISIVGMYSPPFRELSKEEALSDIDRINSSGADIIWVGLGAPKQEKWMNAHEGMVNGVMMGVGAGFDFHAGTIKRSPKWIQKMGFEWLYRLFQDPKRLISRYLVTNTKFFYYSLLEKVKK
ncbi:MAG: WecB/TagA/CpsF family glycosyltransferase [Butyrivibrio sp.]|nr:WecB/TagA/CpsF family glycosyltransferase [Butyrivibrio sp.]